MADAPVTRLSTPAADAPRLTPKRLDAAPSLDGPMPQALTFSPDGRRATYLRGKTHAPLQLDVWAVDVEGGEPRLLVDSAVLAPEPAALSEEEKARRERLRQRAGGIVSYAWDAQGTQMLVPLNGDLYLVHVDQDPPAIRQLTDAAASDVDAKLSPAGGYASFVRDGVLRAAALDGSGEMALSPPSTDGVTYGLADFIAQEEMHRHTGYWWSPDDRYVAYARVDERGVEIIDRLDIDADGLTVRQQRYPRAGTPNAHISLFVRDMHTGENVEVDLGAEADIYLARVDWWGDRLIVQRQNRAQTTLDVLQADPATGASTRLMQDTADTWINLHDDFKPVTTPDGFVWTSERDGFRHIYFYAADGEGVALQRQVTRGAWMVKRIVGVDAAAGDVYFEAFADTPLESHLYRASVLTDDAAITRITTPGRSWSVTMNRDATAFLATVSDPDHPPQTGLFSADGALIRWIEENALDDTHPYAPYRVRHQSPAFPVLEAEDGTPLHAHILRPPEADAPGPRPAVVMVYGGPGAQTVSRTWTRLVDQMFVQHGFVVFQLDNRGSANRGVAFESVLHRRMGAAEVRDQLRGLEHLKSLPFVDAERVGVLGWSYGGYMTLKLMSAAPQAFAAGIAGAPVSDWTLYDTHYTERFLGAPADNRAGYAASSVFADLHALERPLLIMHGMADDNVTFDNATRVFQALQEAGKPFETMVYPGERHGIYGPRAHMIATWLDFFQRRLQPQAD